MTDSSFDVEIPGVILERVIGRGASSTVYLGTQVRFGRKVAVKVLDRAVSGVDQQQAFQTECQTLGRLATHPDIVTVFDADVLPDGDAYLVLDYLAGGPVSDRLVRDGTFPIDEVCRIGVRLAGALESAHRADVVHGDVKPQNVLWSRIGDPALVDFGVARFMSAAAGGPASLTPAHAAPELRNGQAPTPASDVYGLASTLHELATGVPPEFDEATGSVDTSKLEALGGPCADAIVRGLAPQPGDRPASAAAFGELLQAAQEVAGATPTQMVVIDPADEEPPMPLVDSEGALTMPPPPEPSASAPTSSSGRGRTMAVVGLAAVALVAAVAWAAGRGSDQDQAASTTSTTTTVRDRSADRRPGPQPNVDYEKMGRSSTDQLLAQALGDRSYAELLDPAAELVPAPVQAISRTPVRLEYQFYNPKESVACPGFLTSRGVLLGQSSWFVLFGPDKADLAFVNVQEFETRRAAREVFLGISLEQGPRSAQCSGLPSDSQARLTGNVERVKVTSREPALPGLSPKVSDYTSWSGASDDPRFLTFRKVATQVGNYVVGIGISRKSSADPISAETTSDVVNAVVSLLPQSAG